MTDTEINITIAEITGEEHGLVCHSHGLVSYDRAIPHKWQGVQVFKCPWCKSDLHQIGPNYTTDLNAMHEAEETLDASQCAEYARQLMKHHPTYCVTVLDNRFAPTEEIAYQTYQLLHATARQHAEAFLRALDKWKEDA